MNKGVNHKVGYEESLDFSNQVSHKMLNKANYNLGNKEVKEV